MSTTWRREGQCGGKARQGGSVTPYSRSCWLLQVRTLLGPPRLANPRQGSERTELLVSRLLHRQWMANGSGQRLEQRAVIRLASQEIVQVSAPARQAFRVTHHERFIGVIRAILEARIASGELCPADPHLATWTLLGMMYPYLYPADSDDAQLSDKAIEQMATI